MKPGRWSLNGWSSIVLLSFALASPIAAAPRQAVPHSNGAAPRAAAPSQAGGSPTTAAAQRGRPAPRGTASGVATYGYPSGYGYGYGSYWGSYPYWGWGWGAYGGWGWSGYAYPAYGAWYAPYPAPYVVSTGDVPRRGPAVIETDVSPSKAEVLLDGESVGFARDYSGRWDVLRVPPGPHTIAFRKKGYTTLVFKLDARSGALYRFNDSLVEGEGEDARSISDPAASLPRDNVMPAPSSAEAPAAPASGTRTTTGRLRVVAEPADAAVYLDGEYLGLAAELARIHSALAVTTGSHRIEAVRPGYASSVRVVDVGETDLAAVEIILEREH